jgi:ribose/xylose/arabinose/galactoside ABC-type transport system permease subunit
MRIALIILRRRAAASDVARERHGRGVHGIPVAVFWLAAGSRPAGRSSTGCRSASTCGLGGSEAASWSAGVNVVGIRILAYGASGFYQASPIMLAGLTQSGDPTIGAVYLLNGIAAVVVGGTSLVGGIGRSPIDPRRDRDRPRASGPRQRSRRTTSTSSPA